MISQFNIGAAQIEKQVKKLFEAKFKTLTYSLRKEATAVTASLKEPNLADP